MIFEPASSISIDQDAQLRKLSQNALVVTVPSLLGDRHSSLGTLTPPISSPLSSQNDSSTKPRKKVNFCPWSSDPKTTLISSPAYPDATSAHKNSPPRTTRKPLRSILKNGIAQSIDGSHTPTDTASAWSTTAGGYFELRDATPITHAIMLDSALKLLATPMGPMAMQLRLDGYQTLNGAFKTYSDLPDEAAVKSSLPQLIQYIQRDVTTIPRDASGMNLITQALKLSITFMHSSALASLLDHDFQTALFDNALDILVQPVAVKAIANHFLYVLASQDFGPRVLLPSKVEALLDRLDTLHERVSGNSAIASRLAIYSRLVQQCPTVMASKVKTWLKHILHGVLSSHKDVRARAIDCGMVAGVALAAQPPVTKTLADIFAATSADGGVYGEYFTSRLSDMLNDKAQRPTVARIWAMVIVLMRSHKRSITDWSVFRSFLLIIQRCMNSQNVETNHEAMRAWNRLICVAALDRASVHPRDRLTNLLKAPYLTKLGRPAATAQDREMQRTYLHSYCNLLFYALQPSQSHERLDAMWGLYIKPFIPVLLEAGGKDAKFAVKILKTLLHGGNATWDAEKASGDNLVTPSDLPRLDPAWIRSRLTNILELIGPFFDACLWLQSDSYNVAATPWNELNHALADAARHEVRTSLELKQSLAHLVNFFTRLWTQASYHGSGTEDNDVWIQHYCALLDTSIKALSPVKFSEHSMTEESSSIVAPSITPSHRISKHHTRAKAPLVYLVQLFFRRPPAVQSGLVYQSSAIDLMLSVCQALPSHEARFALIRACVPKSMDTDSTADHGIINCIIECAARTALDDDTGLQQRLDVHQVLRQFMMTFEDLLDTAASIDIPTPGPLSAVTEGCLETLILRLEASAGMSAVNDELLLPVVHCLAHCHARLPPATILSYVTFVLTHFHWQIPPNVGELSLSHASLYDLITISCRHMRDPEICADNLDFVDTLKRWLFTSNISLRTGAIREIQDGLACLIRGDDDDKAGDLGALWSDAITEIWDTVLDQLFDSQPNDMLLEAYSDLILAGFCSHYRAVVESTIGAWNVTLGQVDSIRYPPELASVLKRLQLQVRLVLPTFPADTVPQESMHVPYLLQAQADVVIKPENQYDEMLDSMIALDHAVYPDIGEIPLVDGTDEKQAVTIEAKSPSRRSSRLTTTTRSRRPRHDDSQVQFCEVQSSPLPIRGDESQHLTEHQVEVHDRQQNETARMFPELSSSPVPSFAKRRQRKSVSKRRRSSKRLTTPEPVTEGSVSVDDQYGSPTPRANKMHVFKTQTEPVITAQPVAGRVADEVGTLLDDNLASTIETGCVGEARYVAEVQHADLPDRSDGDDDDDEATQSESRREQPECVEESIVQDEEASGDDQEHVGSDEDTHEDEDMQEVNLQVAVSEPGDRAEDGGPTAGEEESSPGVTTRSASKRRQSRSRVNDDDPLEGGKVGSDDLPEVVTSVGEPEIDRQPDSDDAEPDENDNPAGMMTRSASKRKRVEDDDDTPSKRTSTSSSKRQRTQSPVKALLGKLWSSSASSIIARSPSRNGIVGSQPIGQATKLFTPPRHQVATSQPIDTARVSETRARNARSRPITVEDSILESTDESSKPRRSKRKAGTEAADEPEPADAVSSASKRARRQSGKSPGTRRRASRQAMVAETRSEESVGSQSSRVMEAVVIPATVLPKPDDEDMNEDVEPSSDDHEIPESQSRPHGRRLQKTHETEELTDEIAESQQSQGSQLTNMGKSLFGKLRDVWNDFSRMALGFQEAQEYDNMLQDIRKEVMEAENRGRQPGR